ncbi:unnamed protein product [Clavelina lepadiformis]|uniref:Arf-GAP domain-containing protein n=1 Tax=Clavelina lepadiformis TaxID=159417 RepID=A0ABP0GM65_CLALP
MTKPKIRTTLEICADCSAPEPCWASVNRGVYMCNDCAGVHRNLGRHVSQVKHLQKSIWHENQLNMVKQLVLVGANSIWEHSLLDPQQIRSGKRKPNPSDSIHSTKNDFIRAKYEQLAYVHRPPRQHDEDLGKQLHSSVRTANLDTSLRLLSLGAHANFFHSERGNTPLHVAAKAGQAYQIELLVTYGADPAARDTNRLTPEDLARAEGHNEIADRLIELQYELSDRLSNFVWGLKPDHKSKNHYAMSKARNNGVGQDGRKRLQALSNQIFEELAMDVYDEVDRRETEQIWQEVRQVGAKIVPNDHIAVPFLTVNPDYTTTRNQGRQKLARFTPREFAVLISDILHDIIRRQSAYDGSLNLCQSPPKKDHCNEDPIYDLPPDGLDYQSIEDSAVRPSQPVSIPLNEYLVLKQKLQESEEKCTKLLELNRDLSNKVTSLAKHNHELLKQKQQVNQYSSAFKPMERKAVSKPPAPNLGPVGSRTGSSVTGNNLSRPTSVYNATESLAGSQSSLSSMDSREQRRRTIHETQHGVLSNCEGATQVDGPCQSGDGGKALKKTPHLREQSPHNSTGSEYDNNIASVGGSGDVRVRKGSAGSLDTLADKQSSKNGSETSNTNENNNIPQDKPKSPESLSGGIIASDNKDEDEMREQDPLPSSKQLPRAEEVIRKTETVTRNIQNLLQAAQKSRMESYLNCSENIRIAVQEIVDLFPENPDDKEMSVVLKKLIGGAGKLKSRCIEVADQGIAVNSKQVTEEIIKNAYDIAKAEKELVTMTTKLQSQGSSSASSM